MADVVTLALCGVVGRPRYRPVVVGCSLFASVLFLCSAPDDLLCSGVETMFRLLSVALALCATRLWPRHRTRTFRSFWQTVPYAWGTTCRYGSSSPRRPSPLITTAQGRFFAGLYSI